MINNSFINKAKKIHQDTYNYSEVIYINAHTKVKIICSIHGVFLQTPNNHLSGYGCSKCGRDLVKKKLTKSLASFIIEANIKHNNTYKYDKSKYMNDKTKLIITCDVHR